MKQMSAFLCSLPRDVGTVFFIWKKNRDSSRLWKREMREKGKTNCPTHCSEFYICNAETKSDIVKRSNFHGFLFQLNSIVTYPSFSGLTVTTASPFKNKENEIQLPRTTWWNALFYIKNYTHLLTGDPNSRYAYSSFQVFRYIVSLNSEGYSILSYKLVVLGMAKR